MMITVFGATGRTGAEIVRQALAAGHRVVAVVRDPARLGVEPSGRLVTRVADVRDPAAILAAIEGTDAVASALGPRPGDGAGICSAGARSIIEAMTKVGRSRLVVISASGPFVDAGDGAVNRYVAKPILGRLLREPFADLRRMEEAVRTCGLQWTIMRPPRLLDRPATGRYRTTVDRNPPGVSIARADLATATLGVLGDPATIGHVIGVSR